MLKKSPENFSLAGSSINSPFGVFLSAEGQKLPNHDENQQRSRHSLYKCVYQIWGLYIIFEAMNAEKWLWPIFGCKVGQSVPIGMKLELDVWHCLLNVYTMFQNDISKHVKKSPENFAKSKTRKNNRQKSENTIFAKNGTYVEKYTAGHLRTKFEEFTLIYKTTIAKIEFDLLLAVN